MPESSPKMLPDKVVRARVRCGKQSRRCATGRRHVAHYRYWWEDGRKRKEHVRRSDVAEVKAACARWREGERAIAALLNSPGADRVRAEQRANLRAACGGHLDERELRCLRGRGKLGRRDEADDALMLAARIATADRLLFELSMFDFRRDKT